MRMLFLMLLCGLPLAGCIAPSPLLTPSDDDDSATEFHLPEAPAADGNVRDLARRLFRSDEAQLLQAELQTRGFIEASAQARLVMDTPDAVAILLPYWGDDDDREAAMLLVATPAGTFASALTARRWPLYTLVTGMIIPDNGEIVQFHGPHIHGDTRDQVTDAPYARWYRAWHCVLGDCPEHINACVDATGPAFWSCIVSTCGDNGITPCITANPSDWGLE